MLGKFVSKKQADIKKGNCKKIHKKPPKRLFSQKGLMDKNQTTKDGILKGTTKDNKEKNRIGRKEEFWRQAFWGNKTE